jgi:hypothetical protein
VILDLLVLLERLVLVVILDGLVILDLLVEQALLVKQVLLVEQALLVKQALQERLVIQDLQVQRAQIYIHPLTLHIGMVHQVLYQLQLTDWLLLYMQLIQLQFHEFSHKPFIEYKIDV